MSAREEDHIKSSGMQSQCKCVPRPQSISVQMPESVPLLHQNVIGSSPTQSHLQDYRRIRYSLLATSVSMCLLMTNILENRVLGSCNLIFFCSINIISIIILTDTTINAKQLKFFETKGGIFVFLVLVLFFCLFFHLIFHI